MNPAQRRFLIQPVDLVETGSGHLSSGRVTHLFSQWPILALPIREASHIVLFLDFDGTLVPIAPRPGQVRLQAATRGLLRRLAPHPRLSLIVISGRRRAELQRFIGIRGIRYLGLYGWEHDGKVQLPMQATTALRSAHDTLRNLLSAFPDVWIEDKRHSLSIHLPHAAHALRRHLRRALRVLLRPFLDRLHIFENCRDFEIVPRSNQGKGRAVRDLLAQPTFRRALVIYFGDDLSDEPAFAAIPHGVSVHVGSPRATYARYFLRNPAEVTAALKRLEGALS